MPNSGRHPKKKKNGVGGKTRVREGKGAQQGGQTAKEEESEAEWGEKERAQV